MSKTKDVGSKASKKKPLSIIGYKILITRDFKEKT